jgi:hypothetical protein
VPNPIQISDYPIIRGHLFIQKAPISTRLEGETRGQVARKGPELAQV